MTHPVDHASQLNRWFKIAFQNIMTELSEIFSRVMDDSLKPNHLLNFECTLESYVTEISRIPNF